MHHGTPIPSSLDEAEYYFQELRAQRLRAQHLFNAYLGEDEASDDADDDYYDSYFEDVSR